MTETINSLCGANSIENVDVDSFEDPAAGGLEAVNVKRKLETAIVKSLVQQIKRFPLKVLPNAQRYSRRTWPRRQL